MNGSECAGMKAMFTLRNQARLNVGSQGVQIGERATQQALAYAAERIQSAPADGSSPQPAAIIGHPDVRRMLVRMKALTQAARALVYRSEEHTSELQSLMRISYAVFCLKKKKQIYHNKTNTNIHNTSETSKQNRSSRTQFINTVIHIPCIC